MSKTRLSTLLHPLAQLESFSSGPSSKPLFLFGEVIVLGQEGARRARDDIDALF